MQEEEKSRERSVTPNQIHLMDSGVKNTIQTLTPAEINKKNSGMLKLEDYTTILPEKEHDLCSEHVLQENEVNRQVDIKILKNKYLDLLKLFQQYKQVNINLRQEHNSLKKELIEFLSEFQIQNFHDQLHMASAGIQSNINIISQVSLEAPHKATIFSQDVNESFIDEKQINSKHKK